MRLNLDAETVHLHVMKKLNGKETARVMKYSAIKLSLGKIKSRVMNLLINLPNNSFFI